MASLCIGLNLHLNEDAAAGIKKPALIAIGTPMEVGLSPLS
ncbi:uncharacterized protein RAG0_02185 [Rhynchosporium agropyri]|uniref:Uncharacterized protein n=1 Tax=Rhynchosporium agropyri TaxID=914238 RepID=A0A1E1K0N3_9HELO|nr:uncharacterized protein RAG0_02185 [Rhynchosporium agropyri]